MLLVRTASIKAFAFTPKIIHILLDSVKRERTDRGNRQEGSVLRSWESIFML